MASCLFLVELMWQMVWMVELNRERSAQLLKSCEQTGLFGTAETLSEK